MPLGLVKLSGCVGLLKLPLLFALSGSSLVLLPVPTSFFDILTLLLVAVADAGVSVLIVPLYSKRLHLRLLAVYEILQPVHCQR